MSISNIRQGAHQAMTVESLTACKNQLQCIKSFLKNCYREENVFTAADVIHLNLTDLSLNENKDENKNEIADIIQCILDITSDIIKSESDLLLNCDLHCWSSKVRVVEKEINFPTSVERLREAGDAVGMISRVFRNRLLIKDCCSELDDCESANSRIVTLLTDTLQGWVPCETLELRVQDIEKLSSLISGLKTRLLLREPMLEENTVSAFLYIGPLVERCKKHVPLSKELAISVKEAWFVSNNIKEIHEKRDSLKAKLQAIYSPAYVEKVLGLEYDNITTKEGLQKFILGDCINLFFTTEFHTQWQHLRNLIRGIEDLQKLTPENDLPRHRTLNQYKTYLLELQKIDTETQYMFWNIEELRKTKKRQSQALAG